MSKRAGSAERFQIGDYYLDQPHTARGGFWYVCRHDAGTRTVRRRSLKTTDFEQAKIALAALVVAAPQGNRQRTPSSDQVLTIAILKAYMDGRGSMIASEDVAARAVTLFTEYLDDTMRLTAPVSFWTPSQQVEAAGWLHTTHGHSAGGIERLFNVMRSAFIDATQVKMRLDALGNPVEAALMTDAPRIVMSRARISAELQIPQRGQRRPTITLDQMASALDAIESEHLFRFAMLALCTWARPQAILDFDPQTQAHWTDGSIDLAPVGWVPTKKRRPRQPMSLCLAGWLSRWTQSDAALRKAAIADGRAPNPPVLLTYKRARVAVVKQAFRRIGRDLGLQGFSQYSFRHFMADQVKKGFSMVPREHRSIWLGHVVREGSRTTDHYESDDPHAIADVALATDCIVSLLAERCSRDLFAIETLLNRAQLKTIGARVMPKRVAKPGDRGGRDRDRTCDPLHVNVVSLVEAPVKPIKRRA